VYGRPMQGGLKFLYLPDALYVLFLMWLICSGPGRVSAGYWLGGKLLRLSDS
jgi:putative oxidoreductase